jgi:ribonuclease BN (tRNA processing enzyme)
MKNYISFTIVLGSGTPGGDTRHGGISVAVVVNGQPYIIDAGPGFWRNSQASTPTFGGKIAALEPKKLTRVFITHLHFDHTEGLAAFMLAPWTYRREEAPQVYGPPGTKKLIHHLKEAYLKDIHLEIFGEQRANVTGWQVKAFEVLPGEIYSDDNVTITAFQNQHGSWDYTYGYRVVTRKPDGTVDRTIVFSGDTARFDAMEQVYAGVDFLFHEAFSFDPKSNPYDAKAPVSGPYLEAFHTSTEDLAEVLKKVRPPVTVLYHYNQFAPSNVVDDERGVKDIKKFGYDGLVIQSQDGDIF